MHLCPYTSADLPALHALDVACFDPPFRVPRAALRRFAETKHARVQLAVEHAPGSAAERLLGFAIVDLEYVERRREGYINTIDVAPADRGQGIATALMHAMEQLAAEAGALAMLLHVFPGNVPALRLYDRLGYGHVQEVADFYAPGVNAWLYRKPLAQAGQSCDAPPDEASTGPRPASAL